MLVDIDSSEQFEAAKELFGGALPPCWWAKTGRGDRLVFAYNDETAPGGRAAIHYVGTSKVKVMVQFGADGSGAHAVVPPSLHFMQDQATGKWKPSGKRYEWTAGHTPDAIPLQQLPDSAAIKLNAKSRDDEQEKAEREERLKGISPKAGDPLTGIDQIALAAMVHATRDLSDANDGSRRLYVCACRAAEHYLSDACYLATLAAYEEQLLAFPKAFTEPEKLSRLRQAERSPDVVVGGCLAEVAFGAVSKFVSVARHPLTDDGNAERLILLADGEFRYVSDIRRWLRWSADDERWRVESDEAAISMVARKGLPAQLMAEFQAVLENRNSDAAEDTTSLQKAYRAAATKAANRNGVSAAVGFMQQDPGVQLLSGDLDADPFLLGTPNGVVDLRTGSVQQSSPSRLITKSTTAGVGSPADAPRWRAFLEEIFEGDTEQIAFLQRLLGMALIGEQREHVLPVFYGTGANGKSVLIDTVSTILGDYAGPMADGLLTASKNDKHPTEVADLRGLRLAFAEETSQAAELDEPKVKRLTGGAALKARYMRQDFFSFTPSHTLILITNYKPSIRGTDEGIWRRIHVLEFSHTIPVQARDPDLKAKLLEERDAILGWMVEGCGAYLESGLQPPERVLMSTESYKTESDPFLRFVEDNLEEVSEDVFLPTSEIGKRCEDWSLDNRCMVPQLAKRLAAKYPEKHGKQLQQRGYRYLKLKPRDDSADISLSIAT